MTLSFDFDLFQDNLGKMVANFQNNIKENEKKGKPLVDQAAEAVVDRMIDEILIEVLSDVHRAFKLGYINDYSVLRVPGDLSVDDKVFYSKNANVKCINCPLCSDLMHPRRLVYHLTYKCNHNSTKEPSTNVFNNDSSFGNGSEEEEERKSTPEKNKNVEKVNGSRKKASSHKAKTTRESTRSTIQKKTLQPSPKVPKDLISKISKDNQDSSDAWISTAKTLSSNDSSPVVPKKCGVKSNVSGKLRGRSLNCKRQSETEQGEAKKLLASETPVEVVEAKCLDQFKPVTKNFSEVNITPSPLSFKKKGRKTKS